MFHPRSSSAALLTCVLLCVPGVRAQVGLEFRFRETGVGTDAVPPPFPPPLGFHFNFPANGTGRWLLDFTNPDVPGFRCLVNSATESTGGPDGYIYAHFQNLKNYVPAGGFSTPDAPYNIVFFRISEPTPYGLEMLPATEPENVTHMVALVRDPGGAEYLDRQQRFSFRSLSLVTTPLGLASGSPDVIYRKRNGTEEGVAKGMLPPGDYALCTAVVSVLPGENGPFIASTMESWSIVGKVAAWRESNSGSYLAAAPWIAQQQPAPDFRVLFNRPDAIYTVSGVSGTIRSLGFGGFSSLNSSFSNQILTLQGGALTATEEVFLLNDLVRLDGLALTSPRIQVQGNAPYGRLELLAGSSLRADQSTSDQVIVGPGAGSLLLRDGSNARVARLLVGSPDECGGGGGKRPAAAPNGGADPALLVRVEGADVHLGANAFGSGAALAIANELRLTQGGTLECRDATVDQFGGAQTVQMAQGGRWTAQRNFFVAPTGSATLSVLCGSTLSANGLVIGQNAGASGTLTVEGNSARAQSLTTSVGHAGTGRLEFLDQASATLGAIALGQLSSGQGSMAVGGAANLDLRGVVIGRAGTGSLSLSGASFVNTQAIDIGVEPGSNGTLTVAGPGTTLLSTLVNVGQGGTGLLEVSGGALLQGVGFNGGIGGGQDGRVRIRDAGTVADGCGFVAGRNGTLQVSGGARLTTSAVIAVPAGTVLLSNSPNSTLSELGAYSDNFEINQGSTVTTANAKIGANGTLRVQGGGTVLTIESNLLVGGRLEIGGGARVVARDEFSRIALDAGARVSGNNGTLAFPLSQVINDFGILLPGASPGTLTLESSYVQGPGGVLEMEIGGISAGVNHDRLVVTGDLMLNGLVVLRFVDGFLPATGQTFELIDVTGSRAGNPLVVVQGLAPGWKFAAGFNGGSGKFEVASLSDGAPAPPPPADSADADGDGLPYLLERSIGSDPAVAGRDGLPKATLFLDPKDGKRYLTFTYRRALAATDVVFQVETSPDLLAWQPAGAEAERLGTPVLSPDGQTLETTLRLRPALEDQPPGAQFFARLRVSH